jgi:hypothetical protein
MSDQIRVTLLDAANRAVFDLAKEINGLIDTAHMFVERYHNEKPFLCKEIAETCLLISSRYKEIAERVTSWRSGTPPVLSRWGFRANVIDELSINCNILYAKLVESGIEVDCSPHIYSSCIRELLNCDHNLSR